MRLFVPNDSAHRTLVFLSTVVAQVWLSQKDVKRCEKQTINLKNDINKIRNCVIQWKMDFDTDCSKPAQEVMF